MAAAKPLSALVLFAGLLGAASCTDNQAAYEGILGPTREEVPASSGGTSGSDTGGALSTGGTPSAGAGGVGGMAAGGSAGSGGSAGLDASKNPPPHPDFSPPCYLSLTQAGEEILKGTPCTSADVKVCYRSCGPNQVGWKTETCTAGVYAEGDCRFPVEGDYACYKIPETIDKGACAITAPPAATDPCEAPACMSCNFDGFYEDTAGDAKEGYCICRDPDEEGVRRWTCASITAWPCPTSRGC
jgi:hypothetical protein